ncbi:MAG TPA: tetratricopeptide repeat protein [Mariprofundaceae bacterium]|nr:tetratricopeptide repeat protein [Mariprofundaceae bacterium]
MLGGVLAGCAAPHKPATAFSTAFEYRDKGEMTEYRRALEREVKTNPGNLDARYDLALDFEESNHKEDARKLYEENLQHRWHFPSAINLANLLQRQGDTAQAEKILQQTSEHFPHEATPWYLLAGISAANGQNEQAKDQFGQAIAADPNNGFARLRFAEFLAAQGNLDEATDQAHKAVALLPMCAPCWQGYGDILHQAGKDRDAVTAYQRSLALRPDPDTRLRLIRSLQAINETVRAEHMRDALNALKSNAP